GGQWGYGPYGLTLRTDQADNTGNTVVGRQQCLPKRQQSLSPHWYLPRGKQSQDAAIRLTTHPKLALKHLNRKSLSRNQKPLKNSHHRTTDYPQRRLMTIQHRSRIPQHPKMTVRPRMKTKTRIFQPTP